MFLASPLLLLVSLLLLLTTTDILGSFVTFTEPLFFYFFIYLVFCFLLPLKTQVSASSVKSALSLPITFISLDMFRFAAGSSTCDVVEEVEGEGDAGGLRVEQGKLRIT